MLFAACFHAEYIVACQKKKKVDDKDFEEILERKRQLKSGIKQEELELKPHIENEKQKLSLKEVE